MSTLKTAGLKPSASEPKWKHFPPCLHPVRLLGLRMFIGTPIARRETRAMRGGVDLSRLAADLNEIESLLRLPGVKAHIEKAKRLTTSIARRGSGPIAHRAMLLLSAIEDRERGGADGDARIQAAISDLRAALGSG